MEKYNFTVGSRPQWTPELIKQLPHGAEIKCCVCGEYFKYNGELPRLFLNDELYIVPVNFTYHRYFTTDSNSFEKYAEIISLPESYLNPEKPVEFEAGEMVEYPDKSCGRHKDWKEGRFTGGKTSNGRFIIESNGMVFPVTVIRKTDPDSELKAMADAVYKDFYKGTAVELSALAKQDCMAMLIEMGKKVKPKNN